MEDEGLKVEMMKWHLEKLGNYKPAQNSSKSSKQQDADDHQQQQQQQQHHQAYDDEDDYDLYDF